MDDRDGSELFWTWPTEIGSGLMSRIKLRSGIILGLANFQVLDDVSICYDQATMPVTFNFCATWNDPYCIRCKGGKKDLELAGSGNGSIVYRPLWQGEMIYPQRVPIRLLTIGVDPTQLTSFLDGQWDSFPVNLVDIANGDYDNAFEQTLSATPAINLAIHQIFECPYEGPLKRFFLEAKTLELITYALTQLVNNKMPLKNTMALHPSEIKRVQEVKKILVQNLIKPPSLLELARKFGVNKNKLNSDFRQVFGTSVFEYLRNCRLEYARDLLECKHMSISEVAYEVGYEHARNFTRAFKNHFGTNPKDHLF